MNLRNLLIISAVAIVAYLVGVAICERQNDNEDVAQSTPPVEEQCAAQGLVCGCWDLPPGSSWQWVCCDPYGHVSSPNACGAAPCPTPTPGPTPTPIPTPPAECRTTSVDSFRNILKPHSGQQVDFTVVACGGDVVATNNNCLANCCELSAEKGNAACADKLYGMPNWYPRGISLLQVNADNTYTQKVVAGATTSGFTRVCGHASNVDGNCIIAALAATVPPCTASGNQGCATNIPAGGFNR